MLVLIFRHGIAVPRSSVEGIPEAERPLTERGLKRTLSAARGLVRLGYEPDAIFTSPYVRARQTAELAAFALGKEAPALTITDSLLPDADSALLEPELKAAGANRPLCVGHAPHLDLFVAHLLGVSRPLTKLGKAGFAAVEIRTGKQSRLVGLYQPRDLRSLD